MGFFSILEELDGGLSALKRMGHYLIVETNNLRFLDIYVPSRSSVNFFDDVSSRSIYALHDISTTIIPTTYIGWPL